MVRPGLDDLVAVVGFGAVVAGVYMISIPAAFIVAGVILIMIALYFL